TGQEDAADAVREEPVRAAIDVGDVAGRGDTTQQGKVLVLPDPRAVVRGAHRREVDQAEAADADGLEGTRDVDGGKVERAAGQVLRIRIEQRGERRRQRAAHATDQATRS